MSEATLFNIVCDGAYHPCERVEEENLVLLGIDGKRQGDKGKYSFFAINLFIPTPLFFRKGSKDEDVMYFHPSRMEWKIAGNISQKERYDRLKELAKLWDN